MYYHPNTVRTLGSIHRAGFVAFMKPTKFGSGVMGAPKRNEDYALRDIACRLVMNCPSRVSIEALFTKHPPWRDVAGAS